jgi:deoxyribodipyrimidine photo-lyase
LADNAACPVIQVETNVLVPVETASPKEEYSAATLRPKINRLLNTFAFPLEEQEVSLNSINLRLPYEEFDIEDIDTALNRLKAGKSVNPGGCFIGGTNQAKMLLNDFIMNKLKKYPELKNDPGLDYSSNLSPYLHFGQIAPLYIYQRLEEFPEVSRSEFIEELVIRRELSMNFVQYNDRYDTYNSLPAWVKATLDKHRRDHRPYQYSLNDLEEARTHDLYWNAAQTEMALTGKMNGYMRMYWGKKILEWGTTPEEAYQAAVHLNNKYNLDGRDPNGFAGIAWCFGKHDRPWIEREIFGTVRYMNAKGLDRKFDMSRYVEKVKKLRLYPGKGQDNGE